MANAESDESTVESCSFHSGLSNEIDPDYDSDVLNSDGEMLPQSI